MIVIFTNIFFQRKKCFLEWTHRYKPNKIPTIEKNKKKDLERERNTTYIGLLPAIRL
ncbi:MAG: hypothetical protein RIS47_2129 [Bacteroidota bacterium]